MNDSVFHKFNLHFISRQRNGNNYRAIQLSVPTAIAHFRVVHRDADDNVIDSRDYNIDLNSGMFSINNCIQTF